jgi:PKD repeat protein
MALFLWPRGYLNLETMKLPYLLIQVLCTLLFTSTFAQNQTAKWMFGANAGLDFMTPQPTPIQSPSMTAFEGCSSIADAAGNLLFYTNSADVWNSSHALMANGAGLFGDPSTTQCVIVKRPGSASEYYIFTIDAAGGPNGLCYSTVDMSLAAGMGSVTTKNTQLYTSSSEKLAAVRHCNGTDIWVLSHDYSGNNFRAFLVTAAGVSLTPIVSGIGTVYNNNMAPAGQMKFSPNGRKIGVCVQSIIAASINLVFELYDFDNSTGMVSNYQPLGSQNTAGYGCEFSADGTKFYGTLSTTSTLIQFDLCANNATTAIQSAFAGPMNYFASLQLAPNGRIYVARSSNATLGVINNPDAAGIACNYSDAGPTQVPYNNLQPGTLMGLPGFMASYLFKMPSFILTYTQTCQTVSFATAPSVCSGSGLSLLNSSWNFGDPASGNANTSSQTTPIHFYQAAGSYTVKLINYYNCYSDTITVPVIINATAPALNVAGTFTICKGQTATYTASGGNGYNWSTGSNNPSITVTPTTTTVYSVTATHTVNSCQASKSFTVYVSPCTAIEQIQAVTGNKLLVYPNPTQGKLTVETEKEGRLTVYNQLGELILEQSISAGKNNVDISKFSNGVYVLKYSGSAGEKIARLIKAE